MSKTKHTTALRKEFSTHYKTEVLVADGRPVAVIPSGELKNARLIAAAPLLLDALKEIVAAADGKGWAQLDPSLSMARAAIAAAAD